MSSCRTRHPATQVETSGPSRVEQPVRGDGTRDRMGTFGHNSLCGLGQVTFLS